MSVVEYVQHKKELIDNRGRTIKIHNGEYVESDNEYSVHGATRLLHPRYASNPVEARKLEVFSELNPDEIAHSHYGAYTYFIVRSGSELYISNSDFSETSDFELMADDCKFISPFTNYESGDVNVLTMIGDDYYVIKGEQLMEIELHKGSGPFPLFEDIKRVRFNIIVTHDGSLFRLADRFNDSEFIRPGQITRDDEWILGRSDAPFHAIDGFDESDMNDFMRTIAIDSNGSLWYKD
jgi:hypothetical protein